MYSNPRSVAVLMATYNSGNFLVEQLDSLFAQVNQNWTLYIHDDGSVDNTLDIIHTYLVKYNNIVLLDDQICGLGASQNFVHLLENVCSDYYMFCDHDDVWLPFKIENTLKALRKAEEKYKDAPILVHTDLILVNKDLKIINESMWHHAKIIPSLLKQKRYALVSSFVTGCTLGFNSIAKKELARDFPSDGVYFHDAWLALQAIFNNAVIVSLDTPEILYRLHGANESGIPNVNLKFYLKRVLAVFKLFNDISKKRYYMKYFGYGSVLKFCYNKIIYNIRRQRKV